MSISVCQWCERYFDNELTETEKATFEAHLPTCAACQHALDSFSQIRQAMQDAVAVTLSEEADLRIRKLLHQEMNAEKPDEILNIDEVARMLKMSVSEVVLLLNELPSFELAGKLRFRRDRILSWIQEREAAMERERRKTPQRAGGIIIQFPGGNK